MNYEINTNDMSKAELLAWVDGMEKVAKENNLMDKWADDYLKKGVGDFMYDVEDAINEVRRYRSAEIANGIAENLGWWIDWYMTSTEKVNVINLLNDL